MEVNRLSQDELTYELSIRGLPTGKVEEMRVHLRSALKAEKRGKSFILETYPFEYDEDITALDSKLEEIKELIESFTGDEDAADYKKILTKIEWSFRRLDRVGAKEDKQQQEKKRIRGELILSIGSLRAKADGDESDGEASFLGEDNSMSATILANARSRVALYKWDLKFSGEQGQSLNSFLERVLDFAEARGIKKLSFFTQR